MTDTRAETIAREKLASYWADWLVDAVGGATQNRRYLADDPAADHIAIEAIRLNGLKAITNAILSTEAAPSEPLDDKLVYIKPLRTLVRVQTMYADQVRDLCNAPAAPSEPVAWRTPARETFWLIERKGHGQWIKDHGYGPNYDLTHDVWHAHRYETERAAYERWRYLSADDRMAYAVTEHVFINRIEDAHPPAQPDSTKSGGEG